VVHEKIKTISEECHEIEDMVECRTIVNDLSVLALTYDQDTCVKTSEMVIKYINDLNNSSVLLGHFMDAHDLWEKFYEWEKQDE